jgi:hypothetical protein
MIEKYRVHISKPIRAEVRRYCGMQGNNMKELAPKLGVSKSSLDGICFKTGSKYIPFTGLLEVIRYNRQSDDALEELCQGLGHLESEISSDSIAEILTRYALEKNHLLGEGEPNYASAARELSTVLMMDPSTISSLSKVEKKQIEIRTPLIMLYLLEEDEHKAIQYESVLRLLGIRPKDIHDQIASYREKESAKKKKLGRRSDFDVGGYPVAQDPYDDLTALVKSGRRIRCQKF